MSNNTYSFRTALGGFHKGDVIGYVEKIASQHRSELLEYEKLVTSLREENRTLQQQMNLLMMSTPLAQEAQPAPVSVIAEPPVEEAKPQPAVSAPAEDQDLMHMELLAYRRAEEMERNANRRAKKLYQQMGTLCEDTLEDFQSTDDALKQAIQVILSQMSTMEQSYQKLAEALLASKEKLAAMNELLSIDAEE